MGSFCTLKDSNLDEKDVSKDENPVNNEEPKF